MAFPSVPPGLLAYLNRKQDPGDPMPALPDLRRPEINRLPGPIGPPDDLGSITPPYRQPSRYEEMTEAREVFQKKPESRFRAGLRGALYGAADALRSGQGLGGALGGAVAGGAIGGISPSTMRRRQFEMEIAPQIQERFAYEDQDRAQRLQAEDRALNQQYRRAQIGDLESQAEARRLPRPVAGPAPAWKLGTSRRTGRKGYYNAADPAQASEFDPHVEEQRPFAPHWVETPQGFVNLNDPKVDPKKVRKLQRPRGSGGGARDTQRQTGQAAAGIAAIEKLAREAMEKPEAERAPILNQMRAMVANLEAQFPGQLEVGEHNNWPFARLRRREATATRPTSKSNDPLGIR